jgi:hypothetical protein
MPPVRCRSAKWKQENGMAFLSALLDGFRGAAAPSPFARRPAIMAGGPGQRPQFGGDERAFDEMVRRFRGLQMEQERLRRAGRPNGPLMRTLEERMPPRLAVETLAGVTDGGEAVSSNGMFEDADPDVRSPSIRLASSDRPMQESQRRNPHQDSFEWRRNWRPIRSGVPTLPPGQSQVGVGPDMSQVSTGQRPPGDLSGYDYIPDVRGRALSAQLYEQGRRLKGVNGYGYIPRGDEENEFARALFAESTGSPRDMRPMASTILNRVRPRGSPGAGRFGNHPTLSQVLRHRRQFSFQPNNPGNGPEGSRQYVLSGHPELMSDTDRKSWAIAQDIARRALAGKLFDETDGATSYFSSARYNGSPDLAPGEDFQDGLRAGTLRQSPYRSPYPQRPDDDRAPRPSFFFRHRDDIPDKP